MRRFSFLRSCMRSDRTSDLATELHEILRPFMLRRLKDEGVVLFFCCQEKTCREMFVAAAEYCCLVEKRIFPLLCFPPVHVFACLQSISTSPRNENWWCTPACRKCRKSMSAGFSLFGVFLCAPPFLPASLSLCLFLWAAVSRLSFVSSRRVCSLCASVCGAGRHC